MEHNPYITLNDETEITYSDIKRKDGKEYITISFETPCEDGFKSMSINYPFDGIHNIVGYTEKEISELKHHYDVSAHSAFQFAKEDEVM